MHQTSKKIVALLLSITVHLSCATQLHAQSSLDTNAPVIELNPIAEIQADTSQSFTAQVVDNVQLKDVALYYRRSGQVPFASAMMTRLGQSAYFTVSIDTDPDDLRSIEYYIQARDESGNRTVEGFAFDPYTLVILPSEAPLSAANTSEPSQTTTAIASPPAEKKSLLGGLSLDKVRWWHVAGGVLLAGAVATLANSGGSSGSSTSSGDTVPLTINLTGP